MHKKTKLKVERIRRGWSQQQLGVLAGVGAADVSRIENSRLVPYESQAAKLAKVLGIKPSELQEPADEAVNA